MIFARIIQLISAAAAFFATHNVTQILNATETQIEQLRQLDASFENLTGYDIPWVDETLFTAQVLIDTAELVECGSTECEA